MSTVTTVGSKALVAFQSFVCIFLVFVMGCMTREALRVNIQGTVVFGILATVCVAVVILTSFEEVPPKD